MRVHKCCGVPCIGLEGEFWKVHCGWEAMQCSQHVFASRWRLGERGMVFHGLTSCTCSWWVTSDYTLTWMYQFLSLGVSPTVGNVWHGCVGAREHRTIHISWRVVSKGAHQ